MRASLGLFGVALWGLVGCNGAGQLGTSPPPVGEQQAGLGGPTASPTFWALNGMYKGEGWVTDSVDHNNLHYKFGCFGRPDQTCPYQYANMIWGIEGSGHLGQNDNYSGGYDLGNVVPGALWHFQVEFCINLADPFPQSATCSDWSPTLLLYSQAPGTSWLDSDQTSMDILNNSVEAGWEILGDGSKRSLKACAVFFNGGEHVGKWFGGNCFIGWGGQEFALGGSMVLNSLDSGVGWTWTSGGNLPSGAVAGGWENGNSQYVCRAWFGPASGYQVGKTIGDGCNYSWGGVEHHESGYYQVLTN